MDGDFNQPVQSGGQTQNGGCGLIALVLGLALAVVGLIGTLDAIQSGHKGNDLAGLQAVPFVFMLTFGGLVVLVSLLGKSLQRRGTRPEKITLVIAGAVVVALIVAIVVATHVI